MDKCVACQFYDRANSQQTQADARGIQWGQCRRSAPHLHPVNQKSFMIEGVWPHVRDDDWCGEWKAARRVESAADERLFRHRSAHLEPGVFTRGDGVPGTVRPAAGGLMPATRPFATGTFAGATAGPGRERVATQHPGGGTTPAGVYRIGRTPLHGSGRLTPPGRGCRGAVSRPSRAPGVRHREPAKFGVAPRAPRPPWPGMSSRRSARRGPLTPHPDVRPRSLAGARHRRARRHARQPACAGALGAPRRHDGGVGQGRLVRRQRAAVGDVARAPVARSGGRRARCPRASWPRSSRITSGSASWRRTPRCPRGLPTCAAWPSSPRRRGPSSMPGGRAARAGVRGAIPCRRRQAPTPKPSPAGRSGTSASSRSGR